MHPKIYHITHVNNLPSIIADGGLLSDAAMIDRGGPATTIGMSRIKQRRLTLPVHCHSGTCVGDYVPFYFCSRSVMLYKIHCANDLQLTYRGGQGPIIHLEADLRAVVDWSDSEQRLWAFSLSNAGAYHVEFRNDVAMLNQLNWSAIAATQWKPAEIRDPKQAEFLVHGSFPWELVGRIGVRSADIQEQVNSILRSSTTKPRVEVIRSWYY